jgi:hypothetical protein
MNKLNIFMKMVQVKKYKIDYINIDLNDTQLIIYIRLFVVKMNIQITDPTKCEILTSIFQNMKLFKETDNNDFTYKQEPSYYKSLIWTGNLNDLNKIKIKLVLFSATDKILMDIWYYYRNNISSLGFQKTSHLVGKIIYILVKDEILFF